MQCTVLLRKMQFYGSTGTQESHEQKSIKHPIHRVVWENKPIFWDFDFFRYMFWMFGPQILGDLRSVHLRIAGDMLGLFSIQLWRIFLEVLGMSGMHFYGIFLLAFFSTVSYDKSHVLETSL